MRYVTELKGTGKHKSCLVVGGGFSTGGFNFQVINMPVFACNDSLYFWGKNEYQFPPDYMVYFDRNMQRVIPNMKITRRTKVIGYNENQSRPCDYLFRMLDIKPECRDSDNIGMKVVALCKKVFDFDKIFLIGFDFTHREYTSHYQGETIGKEGKYVNQQKFENHKKNLTDVFPKQFERISHFENVFNLNKESRLKIFPYLDKVPI